MRHSVRYSQNFLHSPRLVGQLVAGSSIGPTDVVLDIGAGSGIITAALASTCQKVLAYEADAPLAAKLSSTFKPTPNVKVISGDFLDAPLPNDSYKVFANIPFNKTSDILRKLLDAPNPPADSYLVIQREAALKAMGTAGRESLFSILHKPWFDTAITHRFHPSDFTPAPRVDIALLRVTRRPKPLVTDYARPTYCDLVAYVFNHANPNILPSVQKLFPGKVFALVQAELGAQLTAKPSQLSFDTWQTLLRLFMTNPNQQSRRLIAGSAAKLQREATTIEKYHRTRVSKNWRSEATS